MNVGHYSKEYNSIYKIICQQLYCNPFNFRVLKFRKVATSDAVQDQSGSQGEKKDEEEINIHYS